MSETKASNQMWGGRFASGPDAIMEAINASIGFDKKLYAQDIRGSIAHARMLAETGIISTADQEKIVHGLNTILSEIEAGTFEFSTRLEDIHMNVEARLAELIGPAAGRLHTARSRNDQVAVDFRLWVKDELMRLDVALVALIEAFDTRIYEPVRAVLLHGSGIPVNVPAPQRYAIHKLIVASRRRTDGDGTAKSRKDVLQATSIMQAMSGQRQDEDLAEAFMEAYDRGPAWREAIRKGLDMLDEDARAQVHATLAAGIDKLGADPSDYGMTDEPAARP